MEPSSFSPFSSALASFSLFVISAATYIAFDPCASILEIVARTSLLAVTFLINLFTATGVALV